MQDGEAQGNVVCNLRQSTAQTETGIIYYFFRFYGENNGFGNSG